VSDWRTTTSDLGATLILASLLTLAVVVYSAATNGFDAFDFVLASFASFVLAVVVWVYVRAPSGGDER